MVFTADSISIGVAGADFLVLRTRRLKEYFWMLDDRAGMYDAMGPSLTLIAGCYLTQMKLRWELTAQAGSAF